MKTRVTIIDLARAADVSVSTVDRIMNKRGPVQRATAEHVLAVAQEIGFTGVPSLRQRLSEDAPAKTLGFVLNKRERHLYGSFAKALADATVASTKIKGKAIIRHVDEMSPRSIADALLGLADECDVIAGVCIEHPRVNQAVHELAMRGIPFWALLSDLSAPHRAGFIGTNGWKLGRTAGWFMSRLCPPNSTIALLMGSEQYLCQKDYESGFVNYLREVQSDFAMLPPQQTMEDDETAYRLTKRLLDENGSLTGIFMGGGGIDGVVRALQERPSQKINVVSAEISDLTPKHLIDEVIDVALSHEFGRVATLAVQTMESSIISHVPGVPVIHSVPMKISLRENL
ncbi:LacI family DNA-binding transcriptional regulator [Rhizobium sp. NPDC090275]|uniref:LacI family DNA-binding transcriptional regulator n=1 Tax=Rhizobium sp. NPDC090275 TaxID=3364498 RepID=UPI00383A1F93